MCGIIGIQTTRRVEPLLVEALAQMEYRGYDSAGIATVSQRGVSVRRATGPLDNLRNTLQLAPTNGTTGLGHTRWATHGGPKTRNAHPHVVDTLSLVHNGVLENTDELRNTLPTHLRSRSETDSELITLHLVKAANGDALTVEHVAAVAKKLTGSFAFLVLDERKAGRMFFAKRGSPLLLCRSIDGGLRASSDVAAFGEEAPLIHVVEDETAGWLDQGHVHSESFSGITAPTPFAPIQVDATPNGPLSDGDYDTYMEKEMCEQPAVMRQLAKRYGDESFLSASVQTEVEALRHVHFVACGSSYYAACSVAGWLETQAKVLTTVSLASEFRYRDPYLSSKTLVVGVSQSGETADTLAALHHAENADCPVLVFTNVPHSTMARLGERSAGTLPLLAGREVCVASTKAFSAQVAALHIFGMWLARRRNTALPWTAATLLTHVANDYERNLPAWDAIEDFAVHLDGERDLLLLGRGALHPVALEGALKVKELAYLRAEGFAAGELKHGPLALVSKGTPVLAMVDDTIAGTKAALALDEVEARGASVFLVAPLGHPALEQHTGVGLQATSGLSFLLQASCMMQVLALRLAQRRGCDVDKPRNLAKSVTVE